jgi:hypothetical protein
MPCNRTRKAVIGLAAVATALALAVPAGATTTYRVSGEQTAIDADAGKYVMSGGLVGKWTTTSFQEIATSPIYQGKGTEVFQGCLDRQRDRSCKGDPSGTLSFTFLYWAKFGSADPASLIWGSCWHPIASGTGDFVGADGVLVFVDTPTRNGLKTAYVGNVTVKHGKSAARKRSAARAAATAAPTACGAPS